MQRGFLKSNQKEDCLGCEACIQVCKHSALQLEEDKEGFRYPKLNKDLCVECGLCSKVCPVENVQIPYSDKKFVFGGYSLDKTIRKNSTSGGAFSSIVDAWCDENYVIFGAEANGLQVYHSYIEDKRELFRFRKSKYSQSLIGNCYEMARLFLKQGKKVVFSGTPCHIAGLKSYLRNESLDNLLTIEVICEGVPSPLYIRKFDKWLAEKYGANINVLDYRYKGAICWSPNDDSVSSRIKTLFTSSKWDFQMMFVRLNNGTKYIKDRWFNPFWSVWLNHLISRTSCYNCPFTKVERLADISLGDLWGVHLYCPDLYGHNGGASLVLCNSEKGKLALKKAEGNLFGHELDFQIALKYQSPLRKNISLNPQRKECMRDLMDPALDYDSFNRKWAKKSSISLLFQKYVWGNRQKIFFYNLFR